MRLTLKRCCPVCGNLIHKDAENCIHCGSYFGTSTGTWLESALSLFIIIVVIGLLFIVAPR